MKEAQETATQRRTLKHRASFMLVRGIKCRDLTLAVKKAGRLKTAFQEINQIPGRSTEGKIHYSMFTIITWQTSSSDVKRKSRNWLFLVQNFISFWLIQAVVLAQSLRYCQVHNYGWWAFIWGGGLLYGVSRIILVCNAYAVTIFWLYFFWFLAYFSRCIGSIALKLPGVHNCRRWTFYETGKHNHTRHTVHIHRISRPSMEPIQMLK